METPKMSTPPDEAVEEMTHGMRMISFKSIIPNAEDVRVTDIDGEPHIWAIDLVMAVKCVSRKNAARDLDAITEDLFDARKLGVKKLPGNGKWEVKLLTLPDAFDLVLVLPGPTARSIRTKVGNYMVRILGGDPRLIREIEDNAASTAPINNIACA